jgi:hypothetical protein
MMFELTDPVRGVGRVFLDDRVRILAGRPSAVSALLRDQGLVEVHYKVDHPDRQGAWFYGLVNPCFLVGE